MSLANSLNIALICMDKSEFHEFFDGFGNILNTILMFLMCFILLSFGIFFHVRIHRSQNEFKTNPESKEQFENLLEALRCKDLYSSLYNIIFLYRRTLTALILVFMSNFPYFQIQALLWMALMTMWYIAYHNPFVDKRMNINEVFNEICVVCCIYTVMLFMMTNDVKFCEVMTLQFIAIVGTNILYFVAQLVPELIVELFNQCKKKKKEKMNAQKL